LESVFSQMDLAAMLDDATVQPLWPLGRAEVSDDRSLVR
jgi:hypothetical protein